MKSIDFKQKTSVIRVLSDENGRKNFNWDRVIYIVFLILLFGFLGYYAFNKIFFIKAQGQVSFENIDIRIPDDIRVLEYQVAEDDSVNVGDSLFIYSLDDDNLNAGNNVIVSQSDDAGFSNQLTWIDREKFALEKKIAMNNIDKVRAKEILKNFENELQHLENAIILDVLPTDRYEYAKSEILRLKTEISKLEAENRQNSNYIAELNELAEKPVMKRASATSTGNGGDGETTAPQVFYSPINGNVTRLYTHQFEVALKQDVIMSIHSDRPMYIKAFFEQEDIAYFNEGDIVNIKFPDGRKSKGFVKCFNYSTFQLPTEFQKRYEPTTRTVAADIYPVSPEDYALWRGFYKMSVTITKYKY
ncbi:MAG: HlyD family secretion protein [Bacteroidia bacterium]